MNRVAVLRGGPSEEYSVSLQTGGAVLEALRALGIPHVDVVITKQGEWLQEGRVRDPERLLETIDVVFVALHGAFGEDGRVQRMLERIGAPFVGSRSLASAIAFNKELTKHTLRAHDILMPRHRRMRKSEMTDLDDEMVHIFREVGDELFVKPLANGSSFGARYAPNEVELRNALHELFTLYEDVLIEEYIRGREATVGILNDFRSESHYAFPPIEIVPPGQCGFFSHEDKYNGRTEEIVPGRFTNREKESLAAAARTVHEVIGCHHLSRSDFIVRNGDVYFLEVNTLPGLTKESLYPKAAAAVGLEFPHLVEHLLQAATTR